MNATLRGWANYFLYRNSNSVLENGACLGVKNIGKPCAGKPHARFDEGVQMRTCSLLYPLCDPALIAGAHL